MISKLSPSTECAELVKHFEGCKLEVYKDLNGHLTIGWGHLLRPSELWIKTISQEVAEHYLLCDLTEAANGVSSLVRIELIQREFDALTAFVYNIGVDRVRESTLLRLINAGKFPEAMTEWAKWDHAGGKVCAGLVARRTAEIALFRAGVPLVN